MNKIVLGLSFIIGILSCADVQSGTIDVCLKKASNLTCEELNYKQDYDATKICTQCPLFSEEKYSCTEEPTGTYEPTNITVQVHNREVKTCEEFPSCAELGYQISKAKASILVGNGYSCSACPLNGDLWACAKNGLVK